MKKKSVQTTTSKSHCRPKCLRQNGRVFVPAIAMIALIATFSAFGQEGSRGVDKTWGERYRVARQVNQPKRNTFSHGGSALARFREWNEMAIDASGLDHTPVAPGENRVFGEQLGPGRSSRAMAIVHIAIFDSINAIVGGYRSFTGIRRVHENTSIDSAIVQAAHNTLVAVFPSQAASFDQELAEDLSQIPSGQAKSNGIALGRRAAAAILALKRNDGSRHAEPVLGVDWFTSNRPGRWRQDPISLIPIALGARWGDVDPFVLQSGRQFRVPAPPSLTSQEYTRAFREVKRLGGDGIVTLTERTLEQTQIGIYWAYDGTPSFALLPACTTRSPCRSPTIETLTTFSNWHG